jgi:hypothetical protein
LFGRLAFPTRIGNPRRSEATGWKPGISQPQLSLRLVAETMKVGVESRESEMKKFHDHAERDGNL